MVVASGARGVVAAFGSLLVATVLVDGAVQIERKRSRTVSVQGKRSMPSRAWRTLSARSQSVWARRRAPATTEIMTATRVWASGMALGLL